MKDPRIDRKKTHSLENIIFISIAAVLCGSETWAKVYFLVLRKIFGNTKEEEVNVSYSIICGDESL